MNEPRRGSLGADAQFLTRTSLVSLPGPDPLRPQGGVLRTWLRTDTETFIKGKFPFIKDDWSKFWPDALVPSEKDVPRTSSFTSGVESCRRSAGIRDAKESLRNALLVCTRSGLREGVQIPVSWLGSLLAGVWCVVLGRVALFNCQRTLSVTAHPLFRK